MVLKDKKVLIIGLGKSGLALAKVLFDRGVRLSIYDKKSEQELKDEMTILSKITAKYFLGGVLPDFLQENFDLVIVSPGVPLTIQPLIDAQLYGVDVIGELELAYQLTDAALIAVTGTNGKTTTTTLIGELLLRGGKTVKLAGNIGIPLVQEATALDSSTTVVVEASSFQLETTRHFLPKIAVMLNLTPDHLDRHKTMENYVDSKKRIFINQSSLHYAVLNYDDPLVRNLANELKAQVVFFSKETRLQKGIFVENGIIKSSIDNGEKDVISWEDVKLKGIHNLENAMAAIAVALLSEVNVDSIRKTLREFPGVAHRLEPIGEFEGVIYINDSKGTNPEATIKALDAYSEKPVILIAGGLDKGGSFDKLAQRTRNMDCQFILLGETAEKIASALRSKGSSPYVVVKDMEEAVAKSTEIAQKGGVVLLSPACASWDMYKNYEERGDHFRKLVARLMEAAHGR